MMLAVESRKAVDMTSVRLDPADTEEMTRQKSPKERASAGNSERRVGDCKSRCSSMRQAWELTASEA